jgi:putative transposase
MGNTITKLCKNNIMSDTNFRHKSVRIRGYDYSQPGAYFITICTSQKKMVFGEVTQGIIHLSKLGGTANQELEQLSLNFSKIHLDVFVVMPNHIHVLITISAKDALIQAANPEAFRHPVSGSIPTIVRAYKSAVTRRAGMLRNNPISDVWQRNYYEHVVRTEREKEQICAYIISNPDRWDTDKENPVVHPLV